MDESGNQQFGCFLILAAAIVFIVMMSIGLDVGPIPGTILWISVFVGFGFLMKAAKTENNIQGTGIPEKKEAPLEKSLKELAAIISEGEEKRDKQEKRKEEMFKAVEEQKLWGAQDVEKASPQQGTATKEIQINYTPSTEFEQIPPYKYPVAMMPRGKMIKPTRVKRSNKRGYTEVSFYNYLKRYFSQHFEVLNDRSVLHPNEIKQYEPDFVLISKNDKNIYIDIEIDEPYEGFGRLPTHEIGRDDQRDQFFIKRGWLVIKFAEIQVHQNPESCCAFIESVVRSIDDSFETNGLYSSMDKVEQWDKIKANNWQEQEYREYYLGINSFGERIRYEPVVPEPASAVEKNVEAQVPEENRPPSHAEEVGPETLGGRNKIDRDKRISFDPDEHRYFIDGNPDTISVTELIEKFFKPFDRKGVAEEMADLEGCEPEYFYTQFDEAARLGAYVHEQIENYYNERPYDDSMVEMEYFKQFTEDYPNMIPHRTEWPIFDDEHMIAGTIDALFEKDTPTGKEYYIFDWKRSKNVVLEDGNIKPPYLDACGKDKLNRVPDSSFGKYSLQLNLYRRILETWYRDKDDNRIKISSMNLLVLHENYDKYHWKTVERMDEQVDYILKASKLF